MPRMKREVCLPRPPVLSYCTPGSCVTRLSIERDWLASMSGRVRTSEDHSASSRGSVSREAVTSTCGFCGLEETSSWLEETRGQQAAAEAARTIGNAEKQARTSTRPRL